jgi:hypothetical protein
MFLAAFTMVAVAAEEAHALLPVYRCAYDFQTKTDAQVRRQWAQQGRLANPWKYMVNGALSPDPRYWDPQYTQSAIDYAAQGDQVYPSFVDPGAGYAIWKPSYVYSLNTPYTFKPAAVFMDGVCLGGCYTPDQAVLFADGEVPIESAMKENRKDLLTLSPDATLDALSFFTNEVGMFIADKVPTEQEILTFHTEGGGELKVTLEHPLVAEDGTMRMAQRFMVGDSLLREDGSPDVIKDITKTKWVGQAYNLKPVTTDFVTNILVAQGFLNGSLRYQHEWVELANRELLRKSIPEGALPTKR